MLIYVCTCGMTPLFIVSTKGRIQCLKPIYNEVIIIIISIQPEGQLWQEPEPSQATGMALAHCILGSFLGVGCHCFPPPLDVPTFASRCLHVQATWETSISERRITGEKWPVNFACDFDFHVNPGFFDMPRKSATWETALLPLQGRHAVDFFARKIRRLRPGSNLRSWVPEASMLTTRPPKPVVFCNFKGSEEMKDLISMNQVRDLNES